MSVSQSDFSREIEHVRKIISRYFTVYDVKVTGNSLVFFCRIDEETLEERFESLRREMLSQKYIPMITIDKNTDKHVIVVAKKPDVKYRSVYVNIVLLIATIITTVLAGACNYAEFDGGLVKDTALVDIIREMFTYKYLLYGGIFFAFPLLTILGAHELGHYFMSKKHKIKASLPFFLPMPPIFSPIGTLGAVISMREPIPNKKALLDIGVAGPIAGFLVALPVTFIGLELTRMSAHPAPTNVENIMYLGSSILYTGMSYLVPMEGDILLHPTAFAGWVGLLVTAINLLPAGQLDGGHIFHGLFGEKGRYISYVTMGFLFFLGIFSPIWLIFAILIIFMLGLKHPPTLNDITKLDAKRKALGAFTVVILIICFVPRPWYPAEADYSFTMEKADYESYVKNVTLKDEYVYFNFTVNNTGNIQNVIQIQSEPIGEPPHQIRYAFYTQNTTEKNKENDKQKDKNKTVLKLKLDVNESKNVTFVLNLNDAEPNKTYEIKIVAISIKRPKVVKSLNLTINVLEEYHPITKCKTPNCWQIKSSNRNLYLQKKLLTLSYGSCH